MARIVDNPSAKELLDQIRAFETLEELYKNLPFVKRLFPKLDNVFKSFSEIKKQTEILLIPDQFNDVFASHGWIAYESMSLEAMKEALNIAESEGVDKAEHFLAHYYNADTLKWGIMRCQGHPEFNRRIRLIKLAKDDYLAERYHACIPLLLSLTDGIVNDVSKHVGIFAERCDLTAWDSIAAHETGLQALASLMRRVRNKTNDKPITIPYRNGILHGRELAFDNRIVAAKCWATLFAVRDWAAALSEGRKEPQRKAETSWRELFQQLSENAQKKKLLEAWKPRPKNALIYLPHEGPADELPEGTPEGAVAEFIENWCKRRFDLMADALLYFIEASKGKKAGQAREDFGHRIPSSYVILGVKDQSAAISEVEVEIIFNSNNTIKRRRMDIRTVYQDAENNPAIRGERGGSWRIVQNSFSSVIYGLDN